MRILVVSVPRERTPHLEYVSESQLGQVRRALASLGHKVFVCTYSPETIERDISRFKPSLIFNLAYGYCSSDRSYTELQHETARRIETFFPHLVGSSHHVQGVAQDKAETARRVRGIVDVPKELSASDLIRLGIGVAKPRFGACHRGVEIVRSPDEIRRLQKLNSTEYLLQEYINGTEYTVGVLEAEGALHVFTPIEIRFDRESAPKPHIMDWDRYRWRFVHSKIAPRCLSSSAQRIFRCLGMRDYARFDFRVRNGVPYLLDANSLPNLDPEISLFPYMSRMDGMEYPELIRRIVTSAISRVGNGGTK